MGFCAGGDTNRKKFTGYERDAETGLDFAQARYFSSTEGRFISADSLLGSLTNPQTFNRYSYVLNNPLNSTDPTGHLPVSATGSGPGSWGGFEGPAPGDLPERYEQEIANIKAVIAENAARNAANESAPEHPDDAGHSGEEATGGGEHDPQDSGQHTTLHELGHSQDQATVDPPSFIPTYAQVPPSGTGYYRYGRPDVEWGDARVISELIAFAANWNRAHPNNDIAIGEMSNMYGQTVRPHGHHLLGLRVDIRPMRTDGNHQPVTWRDAAYSQNLTRELINGLGALRGYSSILFNDPVLIKEGLTFQHGGHDNHLHVTFRF
jgi:RHS repeat-associated protein